MAKSKRKTTLAVLREILGYQGDQYFFANLIGKSPSWVQHTSSGHLPLTREAAYQVGFATGVSPEWLLSGNVESPPRTFDSANFFTQETFQNYQHQKKSSFPELTDPLLEAGTKIIPEALVKILSALHDTMEIPGYFHAVLGRLELFARDLSKEIKIHRRDPETDENKMRKVAFARLVFRSGLLQLKRTKKEGKAVSREQ